MTQQVPSEGGADPGWGHKPTEWSETLRGLIRDRQSACRVDGANFGRKSRPVDANMDCTPWGAKMLEMLAHPGPVKLSPGLSESFYLEAFRQAVGGYRTAVIHGERMEIDDRLFRQDDGALKLLKRQRELYVQHIALAIQQPDEIYQSVEADRNMPGATRTVRRFLRQFLTADGVVFVVAVFTRKQGVYVGTTAFVPMDRKGLPDADYFEKQRVGTALK